MAGHSQPDGALTVAQHGIGRTAQALSRRPRFESAVLRLWSGLPPSAPAVSPRRPPPFGIHRPFAETLDSRHQSACSHAAARRTYAGHAPTNRRCHPGECCFQAPSGRPADLLKTVIPTPAIRHKLVPQPNHTLPWLQENPVSARALLVSVGAGSERRARLPPSPAVVASTRPCSVAIKVRPLPSKTIEL